MNNMVARQAGMLAYNHVYFLIAAVFFIAIPLVLFVSHSQRNGGRDIVPEVE